MALGVQKPLRAQLRLSPQDLRIEQTTEGGYILTVRAEGIGSVLLTESTEDPNWKEASYAFRNPNFHPMNGNERRMLNGEFLPTGPGNYFIIDSTPEPDPQFGMAFRLFVPYVVNFGYAWTRNGEVQVLDGTYLSIRTFGKPYADYQGAFQDNPFILRVVQLPPPPEPPFIPPVRPQIQEPEPAPEQPEQPEQPIEVPIQQQEEADLSIYMEATVEAFNQIAERTNARVRPATHSEELPFLIEDILNELEGDALDLVIVLDTTQSMVNSLNSVRRSLVETLLPYEQAFNRIRVGVVLFRDYFDEYLTRPHNFQERVRDIQPFLDRARAMGGRDIPEAVYEALYHALNFYDWQAETREIILIGDAPPHPRPRGNVTDQMVFDKAIELGVRINTIMLPHP